MPFRPVPARALLLCLITLFLSSCLVHRRAVNRPGGRVKQTLLLADRATLVEIIARRYNAIHDFSATVNMTPALGTTEKNKVTEYKDVRGYIRYRQPADIRIIGLFPVVRNKMFDMVSDGADFKLYIPSRNRFVVGRNEIEKPSANKVENLRPQHFLNALLVHPISAADKILIENYTDEENAFYILHEVRENGGGQLQLTRTIWIDRLDLEIARQLIFDPTGNILTDARYSKWKAQDNVPFPEHVEINRPRDEYAIVIDVVKMDINKGVPNQEFVLDQPPGTTLQVIGDAPAARPGTSEPEPKT